MAGVMVVMMVVVRQGVAAHGHVRVEVGRAHSAGIRRPVRRRRREDGTYVKAHVLKVVRR